MGEKDKANMERDLQEARTGLDEAMRDRANHERNGKLTQALIVESNVRLDDLARALNEADSSRKKLQVENQDLTRQIEESEKKSDALKALSKATAEIQLWKSKFETEGLGRLAEAEETIDTLNQKVATTEKTKHRLETELEDLQLEYERVHAAAIITERRGKNFDKVVGEWQAKAG